jgi:hypothetical protein
MAIGGIGNVPQTSADIPSPGGPQPEDVPSPSGAAVAAAAAAHARSFHPGLYLALAFVLLLAGIAAIVKANGAYAPEMYQPGHLQEIGEALAGGEGYAVFDLNLNIRELRDAQLERLTRRPEIIILGASQWQEAHAGLLPRHDLLNVHVHRDYYEDALGVVEMLVRHDKLPRRLVITIRDKMFTPVGERKDFLWLPGVPYYRAMAERLSLESHTVWETYPLHRARELISLPLLYGNAMRWYNAAEWPHATHAHSHKTLDILLPDGSIKWSDRHRESFTQERAREVSLSYAEASRNDPPRIDPKGVHAIDTLLAFLAARGVEVFLAHPPFNPTYYAAVADSPYMHGLRRVEQVTRELAAKHNLAIIGSFDPERLGCKVSQFIDAEHSNPDCLRNLLAELGHSIEQSRPESSPQDRSVVAHADAEAYRAAPAVAEPAPAAAAPEPLPSPESPAVTGASVGRVIVASAPLEAASRTASARAMSGSIGPKTVRSAKPRRLDSVRPTAGIAPAAAGAGKPNRPLAARATPKLERRPLPRNNIRRPGAIAGSANPLTLQPRPGIFRLAWPAKHLGSKP